MKNSKPNLHDKVYIDKLLENESIERIAKLVKFMDLNKDMVVADFACGNGMLLEILEKKIGEYYGVDFSPYAIRNAELRKNKLKMGNAFYFCESIQTFCEKNNEKFDVGMALDFSEHVDDEQWLQVLKSIKFSLKIGGKLYMHTPNGNFFLEIMKRRNFIFKQFPEHIAVRSATQNKLLLEKVGYKIKEVKFIPHYNFLKYIHLFSFIPGFGSYFQARLFIVAEKI